MQSLQQADWCSLFAGPIQTDALESFVDGPGNTVLCVTSGYNELIGRTVPLACSILFGKSEQHYRQHFRYLFKSLNMKLEESKEPKQGQTETNLSLSWTCMVVDFSTAQHMAFLHEFKAAIRESNPAIENIDSHTLAQSYIRGCQIHYFRSAVRVARIQSVVPIAKTEQFVQLATELVNCDLHRFSQVINQLQKEFPLTTKWINWYLQEDRARLIFKSYTLLADKWNSTVGNTNAQEGTGRDIKYTARLTLFEVIDHIHRYVQCIQQDIDTVASGGKVRYNRKKVKPAKKRKFKQTNDGRPPDTTTQLLPEGLLTSATPYKMAYEANLQASSQHAPIESDNCVRTIDFLKNKNSSCYATSVLFILFHLKISELITRFIQAFKTVLPPNLGELQNILVKSEEKKFGEARKMLMSYIWNHPDGAKKDKFMSYTKFIHVYLENHPSFNSTNCIYRNLLGITYLQHTVCSCGVNSNKIIYNSVYECTPQQINALEHEIDGQIDLETILNFRHHHSHEVSLCPECSKERKQWYSVVDIPALFIVNFESVRTSSAHHDVHVPTHMTIGSNPHPIKLKCVGFISHLSNHWTSSVISSNPETIYCYDDLMGYATKKPFSISKLSDPSTSAVVYIRDWANDTKLSESVIHIPMFDQECLLGKKVHILNVNMKPIADGYVLDQFIDDIAIVLVTCVYDTEQKLTFIYRTDSSTFIKDWENMHIVWRCSMLKSIVAAEPKPEPTPIPQEDVQTSNPVPDVCVTSRTKISKTGDAASKRRRLRLLSKHTPPPSNDSVMSSEYDIELERAKARSRREAKQIK